MCGGSNFENKRPLSPASESVLKRHVMLYTARGLCSLLALLVLFLFDSLQVRVDDMQTMIDCCIMFAYSIERVACRVYYYLDKELEGRQ